MNPYSIINLTQMHVNRYTVLKRARAFQQISKLHGFFMLGLHQRTQRSYCIRLTTGSFKKQHSDRLCIHRCTTQLRFLGINPWDDDEHYDTDESTIADGDSDRTSSSHDTIESSTMDQDDEYRDLDDDDDEKSNNGDHDDKSVKQSPTHNIKKFEVPDGPPPGPLMNRKTRQLAFFQFDYRNVSTPQNMKENLKTLLERIQLTLKDAELEPYHGRRGCETLCKNIDNLPDGTRFRMGGDKKSIQKVGDGYNKAVNVTTHRALRKSIFYLLWERHAIMTSGTTHDWKKLSSKVIGQSLLGPETRLVVDHRLGKEIIQELWIRGVSSKYNRLMKRHDDRSAENHYIRYLQPPKPTRKEVAQMDWNTDLDLKSNEKSVNRGQQIYK